jgi:hypothetical protein
MPARTKIAGRFLESRAAFFTEITLGKKVQPLEEILNGSSMVPNYSVFQVNKAYGFILVSTLLTIQIFAM